MCSLIAFVAFLGHISPSGVFFCKTQVLSLLDKGNARQKLHAGGRESGKRHSSSKKGVTHHTRTHTRTYTQQFPNSIARGPHLTTLCSVVAESCVGHVAESGPYSNAFEEVPPSNSQATGVFQKTWQSKKASATASTMGARPLWPLLSPQRHCKTMRAQYI